MKDQQTTVVPWVKDGPIRPTPRRVERPCDYWLARALHYLETELGTIEAHNRLVECADAFRRKIEAGCAQPQHPSCATDPMGLHKAGNYPLPKDAENGHAE
jgi:hypothetical protein